MSDCDQELAETDSAATKSSVLTIGVTTMGVRESFTGPGGQVTSEELFKELALIEVSEMCDAIRWESLFDKVFGKVTGFVDAEPK